MEENSKRVQFRISVRQLVEFILRSGDIDNRRSTQVENAMLEGTRIHRMIQKRMGDNYHAEVPLKLSYSTPKYDISIEGRADGIIIDESHTNADTKANEVMLNQHLAKEDYPDVTIDEIKSVAKSLEYIEAPVEVHLAQAKVYAYIYSAEHSLPSIRVRMTYCNMETEELKYFYEDYFEEELKLWFDGIITDYLKWTDFQYEWMLKRTESAKKLEFPYPYRDGQRNLAVSVYKTILDRKKLFIEAPTGVGKTLSTVFPVVRAMGEGLVEKIFYLTAKTITRVAPEETFDILRKQDLTIKTLTITAKDKVCILEQPKCDPVSCHRAKGHFDRVNDAIYDAITNYDRIDRNIIAEIADKYNVCPFELSLDISLFADAIICDYNYVFDPHASLKRFFADGNKGEYVFLVDEAHNLLDRGRSMYSAELYKEDFLMLKRDLKKALDEQPIKKIFKNPSIVSRLIKALERCNKELLEMKRSCDTCLILESSEPFSGLVESLHTVMDQFLENEDDSPLRQQVMEFYFEICHYLLIYEKYDENYRTYCENTADSRFMIKLFCVNPAKNLRENMSKGKSTILFSATFLPIQYYKKLLGGTEEDYEIYAKSTFDNRKRGLFIANDVTSKYTSRGRDEYYNIASYIREIVDCRKGNYMVFCPSHSFLANVYEQFDINFYNHDTMNCIIQQEYMNEEMREEFLDYYKSHHLDGENNKSLIGFCVLGGIFSEGIDLRNDSLIGAIIIGTGLPMVCNEREILKEYFDDENRTGFDYAYRYSGMCKVLQAAGRVIRTNEDVGIVALLDKRFNSMAMKRLFPREWDNYLVVNGNTIGMYAEEFWEDNSGDGSRDNSADNSGVSSCEAGL